MVTVRWNDTPQSVVFYDRPQPVVLDDAPLPLAWNDAPYQFTWDDGVFARVMMPDFPSFESDALLDESGNFLVDENGDTLTW